MSDTVIKVENISKQYRLGQVGTGTLSHDLNRIWHKMRGNADPYLKIGEVNDRTQAGSSKYVWSLRDVSFDVKRGEVLGIIGKNGAGKSTLLKILSRVTQPTTGTIKTKGRIASLLEVGTGFHPELTGRENVFLNGAILGMARSEIRAKFDEIVEFSGVKRYIDTPVKRYSSGMYVRLAFAVAAHLEPEILIVDEVLAVGDAEFQKKCLGKMRDVSNSGRTILFVSHNMTAVNTLCSRCLYLKDGRVKADGTTAKIIDEYMSVENALNNQISFSIDQRPGDEVARLISARLINTKKENIDHLGLEDSIGVEIIYDVLTDGNMPTPNIHFFTSFGELAFAGAPSINPVFGKKGSHKAIVWIPPNLLNNGTYLVGVAVSNLAQGRSHFFVKDKLIFEVLEDTSKRDTGYAQEIPGVLRPKLSWEVS